MNEEQYNKQNENEYNSYIKDIDDFFYLPEPVQDKLIRNPLFDYIKIWDRLDYEHKFNIIMSPNFKYEELWGKLGSVEKLNVIQYVLNFDWRKYVPNPNDDELNILLNRHDFFPEEFFHKLSELQKIRVCSNPKFKYVNFWNELTDSMKLEVVKHNREFDPLPHLEELKSKDDTRALSMLDHFCERRMTLKQYYEPIWNDITIFQKMKIAIKNICYEVRDSNEMYELFKTYPFQMLDYIKWKIVPEKNLFSQESEINFAEIDEENARELACMIFKNFGIIDYEEISKMRQEMSTGNGTIEISSELSRYFPFCIVKIKEDVVKLSLLSGSFNQVLKSGYYFCDVQSNTYIRIIDYQYIMKEAKIERLLNNPD